MPIIHEISGLAPHIYSGDARYLRGFGAFTTDGFLSDPMPVLPTMVYTIIEPIPNIYLFLVESDDWTWLDANAIDVPDAILNEPVSNQIRNRVNNLFQANNVDFVIQIGETPQQIIERFLRQNSIWNTGISQTGLTGLWNLAS